MEFHYSNIRDLSRFKRRIYLHHSSATSSEAYTSHTAQVRVDSNVEDCKSNWDRTCQPVWTVDSYQGDLDRMTWNRPWIKRNRSTVCAGRFLQVHSAWGMRKCTCSLAHSLVSSNLSIPATISNQNSWWRVMTAHEGGVDFRRSRGGSWRRWKEPFKVHNWVSPVKILQSDLAISMLIS